MLLRTTNSLKPGASLQINSEYCPSSSSFYNQKYLKLKNAINHASFVQFNFLRKQKLYSLNLNLTVKAQALSMQLNFPTIKNNTQVRQVDYYNQHRHHSQYQIFKAKQQKQTFRKRKFKILAFFQVKEDNKALREVKQGCFLEKLQPSLKALT